MTQSQTKSQYELSRDQRVKANLERMHKLGLADISFQLNSSFLSNKKQGPTRSYTKRTPSSSPIRKPGPVRRSSRFHGSTPVSYTEAPVGKKDGGKKLGSIMLEEGAREEIYTEEHEKLLGHAEKIWNLFVDGIGKDGKRIYDPVRGKTCHQCRQKTLGHRTHCSRCNKFSGQFCGDCLYMRYGENVLEANENPHWTCPVCRGICNCSFCRTAKGWAPTGLLYRKIVQLGYKSVAHYLIQTRRAETSLVQIPETPEQVSARRSLPVPDMNEENIKADHNDLVTSNETSAKRALPFLENEQKVGDHLGFRKLQSQSIVVYHKEQEDIIDCVEPKLGDSTNGSEITSVSKKMHARNYESSPNSIGGRLRQRRQKDAVINADDSSKAIVGTPDGRQEDAKFLSKKEVSKEIAVLRIDYKDSGDRSIVLRGSSKRKKKCDVMVEPRADSIGGRLRQRRKGN